MGVFLHRQLFERLRLKHAQGRPFDRRSVISKKLRISSLRVLAGMLVEGLSLIWNNPLSFLAFLGFSGTLLAAGMLLYLWAPISGPELTLKR
jgi:hypothetical protein